MLLHEKSRQKALSSLVWRVVDHLFGSSLFHDYSTVHQNDAVSRFSGLHRLLPFR
jgi:hypothetical protein